jgi:hypothetical protein
MLDWRPIGSSSFGGDVLAVPVPRQEFVNTLGGVIRQAGQHVGEPSLRVDTVELGGGDQRVDCSGAPAAFVGASEGPVLSPKGHYPFILPMSGRS